MDQTQQCAGCRLLEAGVCEQSAGGGMLQEPGGSVHCIPHLLSAFCQEFADRQFLWRWNSGHYCMLWAIAHELRPKAVMEIGTMFGHSLVALCAGSGHVTRVEGVDDGSHCSPFAGRTLAEVSERHLRKSGVLPADCRIAICEGDSHELWQGFGGPYDLLHVDGDETPEGIIQDIRQYRRSLSARGAMVVSRVHREDVREVFDAMAKHFRCSKMVDKHTGIGLLKDFGH